MAIKGDNQKNSQSRYNAYQKRLGPLNISQLEKLLTNARKKHMAKINRRIAVIKGRPGFKVPVLEATE